MITVTAKVSDPLSFAEVEEYLHDTTYLVYTNNGNIFVETVVHVEQGVTIADRTAEAIVEVGLLEYGISCEYLNVGMLV